MTKAFLFWLIYILSLLPLLFGGWFLWPAGQAGFASYAPWGMSLLSYILIGLLGWSVYGKPIQG